ncbi:MAG: SemiSWEET transporter [Propionivibrio sp.]|nr:SemiSWEET transporter [Propionivibrio sp.]MBK7563428.1 SemiSWEET transporter [Propionivibrio sp.]MBK9028034.1 SemiSWEET transporter [Propionivibrio sp.]HRC60493.1 SemiSWEET transporter [Candidatus Propionivibrio aalborgensis]
MNTTASAVGYAAAILTTISFVPQVLKVWRTRSARDVSLGMYSLFTLGIFTWLVYGVLIESWPVILANFVTLVLAGMVLAMKLKFG